MKIKKLLRAYQDAARRLTGKLISVELADYWQCCPYPESPVLYVGALMTQDAIDNAPGYYDKTFICTFDFSEVCPWMLAFLHEIGHIQTWQEKFRLNRYLRELATTPAQYRQLPEEYLADKFAIDTLNNHFKDIMRIQSELERLYAEISFEELADYIDKL